MTESYSSKLKKIGKDQGNSGKPGSWKMFAGIAEHNHLCCRALLLPPWDSASTPLEIISLLRIISHHHLFVFLSIGQDSNFWKKLSLAKDQVPMFRPLEMGNIRIWPLPTSRVERTACLSPRQWGNALKQEEGFAMEQPRKYSCLLQLCRTKAKHVFPHKAVCLGIFRASGMA